jgi:hypothetical protein
VKFNAITNDAVTNATGTTATCGYQAGVADLGHKDGIVDADSSARSVSSNK